MSTHLSLGKNTLELWVAVSTCTSVPARANAITKSPGMKVKLSGSLPVLRLVISCCNGLSTRASDWALLRKKDRNMALGTSRSIVCTSVSQKNLLGTS